MVARATPRPFEYNEDQMRNTTHTSSAFEADLGELDEKLTKLGDLAARQLKSAVKALFDFNQDKVDMLIKDDEQLDDLELEIADKSVEILALRAPQAVDLRRVLAAQKAASIYERMGDYARNTAKRATAIVASEARGLPLEHLVAMGTVVAGMASDVVKAYTDVDVDMAMKIRDSDVKVDELHNDIHRQLIAYLQDEPGNAVATTHLLFIAKNFERVGDYTTGIAELIYFRAKADMPAVVREKADETSLMTEDS